MTKIPFVSILMPALNEEKNILSAVNYTLGAFDDIKIDGEVIVINDGSRDTTPKIVKELMSSEGERIRLINHDTPQGIGASFWDGVLNARGEIVCLLPGDNENDPCEILRYLKLLDDVDMVVPFVFNRDIRTLFRNILSRIYLLIINTTFGVCFNYTNGTILYRKCILNDLPYRGRSFFFQADILVRLVKMGYLFAEVPYGLRSRKAGKSNAISFSAFLEVFKDCLVLVKDVFFKKEGRYRKHKFSKGSVSAKRYKY